MSDFVRKLAAVLFMSIVAPSLAHAPFAVLTFVIKNLLAGKKLKKHSINNLKASLLALVLGAHRSKFSYCLVSATRGPKA